MQGGEERLFTTLDGNRDIFDECHKTQKPPKNLDEISSTEREKKEDREEKREENREESCGKKKIQSGEGEHIKREGAKRLHS